MILGRADIPGYTGSWRRVPSPSSTPWRSRTELRVLVSYRCSLRLQHGRVVHPEAFVDGVNAQVQCALGVGTVVRSLHSCFIKLLIGYRLHRALGLIKDAACTIYVVLL